MDKGEQFIVSLVCDSFEASALLTGQPSWLRRKVLLLYDVGFCLSHYQHITCATFGEPCKREKLMVHILIILAVGSSSGCDSWQRRTIYHSKCSKAALAKSMFSSHVCQVQLESGGITVNLGVDIA
jgi:hypothetical protein